MSPLMEFLLRNKDDRRVMATLRCGLVESTEMRAWPWLANLGGIGKNPPSRAVRTVAGLFALHPHNCNFGNMGTVCHKLCDPDKKPRKNCSGTNDPPGPMERRFLYLLNADEEEIYGRVCRLVRYAGSRNIPIHYAALEKDLAGWPEAREDWAKEFWKPMKDDAADTEEDAS